MKAKVKETNEIINGIGKYDEGYHRWIYTDIVTKERYFSEELDLEDIVDWEQRRYEIAKDMLAAIESNSNPQISIGSSNEQVKWAIEFADELIKQLKGE